jgi:PAS domain S-box-containing protein
MEEEINIEELSNEMNSIFKSLSETREKVKEYNGDIALLESVWDTIPVLMFLKDRNNCIIKVNKTFCDTLGGEKKDFEGISVDNLMNGKTQASKYAQNDLKVFLSGKSIIGRKEKLFDTNINLRTDKFPVFNNAGEVIGVLGFSVIIEDDAN